MAADAGGAGADGLVHPALLLAFLDAVGVAPVVAELERIGRGQRAVELHKRSLISQQVDVLPVPDGKV